MIVAFVAATLAVVLVGTASVAAIAVWQISSSFEPGVNIQADGEAPPAVGPIDSPVNVLLVGSDSGEGNAAYGDRGENLNDVTILMHISPVSHSATVVSFQRDMYVPIVGCENGNPGTRKINEALYNGGLACAVSTVEALTGLEIGYAAKIEFDGVLAMSDAIGGVEVCVAEAIHDLQIGFDLEPGMHTLQGWNALQFLRSRHGVGDGSDTTRVSNQQLVHGGADAQDQVGGNTHQSADRLRPGEGGCRQHAAQHVIELDQHDGGDGTRGERHPDGQYFLRGLPCGRDHRRRRGRRRTTQGRRESADGRYRRRRPRHRHR